MFPLSQRKLIRGAAAHIAAGLSSGADYVASTGTPLYASSAGNLTRQYSGDQGGKWLWFSDKDGNSIQFAHLSSYVGRLRSVSEGDLIAYTGNTGSVTTGPHLHIQIINPSGVRLDPEKYQWDTTDEYMKFDLFKDKTTGRLYYRMFDMLLQYIDSPDKVSAYFGANPKIYEVGDIHEAGTPLEEIFGQRDSLRQQLIELRKETDQLSAGVLELKQQLEDCQGSAAVDKLNQIKQILGV